MELYFIGNIANLHKSTRIGFYSLNIVYINQIFLIYLHWNITELSQFAN